MAKITYISAQELKNLCKNNKILICDIRENDEFNREHIPGAINTPISKLDTNQIEIACKDVDKVVVHCLSGNRTKMSEPHLSKINQDEIFILDGGINAWKRLGCIVNKNSSAPLPLMRQVQIVAGILIIIGVLLGFFVNEWYFLISGFVGAGLIFAGITGFCGMARLLMLLPYNKTAQCKI